MDDLTLLGAPILPGRAVDKALKEKQRSWRRLCQDSICCSLTMLSICSWTASAFQSYFTRFEHQSAATILNFRNLTSCSGNASQTSFTSTWMTSSGHKLLFHGGLGGKKRSPCINKWLSYSRLQCFAVVILTAILKFVIGFCDKFIQDMSSFIPYNSVEKRRLCINKWLSYSWL